MAETIRVVATLEAVEGKSDELKAVLESMLGPSRGDDGCLSYDLYQDQRDPNLFVFLEEWRDGEAMKNHGAQAHMAEAGAKLKGLLAGRPNIQRLDRIG